MAANTTDGVQLETLTAPDGVLLRVRRFESTLGQSRGLIVLVHGLGEHSGCYQHVAEFFSQAGLSVVAYDQRGHGESGGFRGDTPSYLHLLDDLQQVVNYGREVFPSVPVVLYGHSMGGGVVANYCLRDIPSISGAILSAPWFKLTAQPPWWQLAAGSVGNLFLPGLTLPTKFPPEALTRDPAAIARHAADDLRHHVISLRLFFAARTYGRQALAKAPQCDFPILAMHGTADPITCPASTRSFAESALHSTFVSYEDCVHELHNEALWQSVLKDVKTWIETTIPGVLP